MGAFAAGLVLEQVHLEEHVKRGETPLVDSLHALTALLVPVFFVRMGLLVDLGSFLRPGVLLLRAGAHGRGDGRQVGVRARGSARGLGTHDRHRHDAARRGRA